MKKTLVLTACLSILASIALASPLKNYDPGHFSIDAGVTLPSSMKADDLKMSKSKSGYYGATVGIGSDMAVQYKFNNYKAKQGKTGVHQANLLYRVVPNLEAYAGYERFNSSGMLHKHQNAAQIGLQAHVDIPLLFNVWGNVGYSNKGHMAEIGISKPILNNIELGASYYTGKFDEDSDVKVRGVNAGVTFKF
ncbi:MAG: outer membrane beta-barrel protein [Phascolarctobacterium sp.]|nr:outer membrane beta-barrel protein [Phascolarctobacterium sp.]